MEKKIVLASQSPRRQELLRLANLPFRLARIEVEENYPEGLKGAAIADYLCQHKAKHFDLGHLSNGEILVTADTIVWLFDECIGKPADLDEARSMLYKLSAHEHTVFTGICLTDSRHSYSFTEATQVTFRQLTPDEIDYYVSTYRPLDKAGAYGIQEWIGYVGIEGIKGCYYNVMGLPLQRLYVELAKFAAE